MFFRFNQSNAFELARKNYRSIAKKLKQKAVTGQKLNVCFFVIYHSAWAYKLVFEAMLQDEMFNPFIVVIPDTSRGNEHLHKNFVEAYRSLSSKYNNVLKGYSIETGSYFDFSIETDLVCFPNSYRGMTNHIFEVEYFLDKSILPFYINYSFSVTKWFRQSIQDPAYSYFWKVFVPTTHHLREFKKYQLLKGANVEAVGYPKMDELNDIKPRKRSKKTIILAPHHTVTDWKSLQISNFMAYSKLFLKLPELYPNVQFVFRPHPLLVTQLNNPDIWGKAKTQAYLKKLTAFKNVRYSKEGDYLSLFANSDGIIHDCGSFLAEYLFTEKPACYLLKNKHAINKWFIKIGRECIKYCYTAFNEAEILQYIDSVVINGNDPLKEKRINFVNATLKVNYPHVASAVLNSIKEGILRAV